MISILKIEINIYINRKDNRINMCGIVGFMNCGNSDSLHRSTKIIDHRGPDALNTIWFKSHNSGLGHARLSIIDTSDVANQPMHNIDNNTYIVFNGEIYNYREIKKT